jgi:hypothetical protein
MTLSLNQSAGTIFTISNTTAGTSSSSNLQITSDSSSGNGTFGKRSSSTSVYKTLASSDLQLYNGLVGGDISLLNDFASGSIKFAAGGSATAHLTIASTGAATFSSSVTAGTNSSVVGSVILKGNYTSGTLATLGTDGSSGAPMLSYGVESAQSSTEGAFVSSTALSSLGRGAYTISGSHKWYTAAAQTVAVGTTVTMTKQLELFNTGNLVIGGGTDTGEKLHVNGDAKITGDLLLSGTVTAAVNGDYSANFIKTFAQASAISNTNLYGLVSRAEFDLTSGAYSGSESFNATGLFAQAIVGGNASTLSTQPIRAAMASLVGKPSAAAMNLADFRHLEVKSPDDGGVSGHIVQSMYGLKISTLKGSSNYTVTNGWGVYQEGASDNNYFNGSVGIGSTTLSAKLHVNGDIRTAAPTGGTAVNWKLGSTIVTSGATLLDTRYLEVEVDGVIRKIALIN